MGLCGDNVNPGGNGTSDGRGICDGTEIQQNMPMITGYFQTGVTNKLTVLGSYQSLKTVGCKITRTLRLPLGHF